MVAKRSLSHWRLLSSVVLGVLLASAIMAGTVIYFDSLRELALKKTLSKYTPTELDISIQGKWGPVTYEEYGKGSTVTNEQIQAHVAWMVTDRMHAAKTPTFFLSTPDNEEWGVVRKAGEDNARAYFAFLNGLEQKTTLLPGGSTPKEHRLNPPDEPLVLEAMIPLEAAKLFSVGVGDRLVAIPPWQDVTPFVTVVISGVFERNDPADDFWFLEESVLNSATGPSFRTVPFHISERSFMEVLGPSFSKMEGTFAWHLTVDISRVSAENSALTLANIRAMHKNLSVSLSSYRQTTAIDKAIREYNRRIFFSKLSMFVVLILIDMVILYYVAALSSLVVEERRGEVALLRSRGASSAQILMVFVLEGMTIAFAAVLAGPLLAAGAISVLGFTPAFSDLTGGARLDVDISTGAYMMSALGGALSFLALIIPAVQASRIGVTRHRQQAARPSTLPAFQRYYLDVLALLLSILLFRQLTEQGSVVATSILGEAVVNQLLLALPGLMLVAAAMVLLRLFPLVMNLASRMLSAWLPAGLVMGVWQMARNPTHYARLSLLLILTAGLGIFASSFGATLQRSFEERVLYATGGDITIDHGRLTIRCIYGGQYPCETEDPLGRALTLVEAYEVVPGVERASLVLEATGRDMAKGYGVSFAVLAVDSESFSEVAWFRNDFSDRPMSDLLSSLAVTGSPQGILLPDDALSIGVRLKADRPHPSVRVTARIRNAMGRYTTYDLGTLDNADWTVLSTSLGFGRGVRPFASSRPLELVSLRVHETSLSSHEEDPRRLQGGSILIDDIRVRGDLSRSTIIEPFDDAEDWSVLKVAPEAISDVLRASGVSFDGDDFGSVLFSWTDGSPLAARGIFHGPRLPPLPVLASESLAKATGHRRGDEFEVSISGHRVPVRLLDTIDLFPTMTIPKQKFLVADLTSLTRYANLGAINRELASNQVWISSETRGVERSRLVDKLQSSQAFTSVLVRSREERLIESQADPLVAAGWSALLFIAFAAVLILSCLGFMVHAYVSFRNRQLQFALLRTIGFSMRQLITMVWLEQILVIALGLALGTWMGGRLGAIIMPFLGHDDSGGLVMPPFAMQVNWGALLITYAIMVLVFSVIILGIIWLIYRMSLQRILRLGEM
jgi:ABC-type lipoprotein release transport system permease subunit